MRALFTLVASTLLVCAVAASANANLVVNGSFESPVQPPSPGYANYTTGTPFDAVNWPLTNSMVIANGIFGTVASNGSQWLSLETVNSPPNTASITQTIPTPIGFVYELTFDYSVLLHSTQTAWSFSYTVNGITTTKNLTTIATTSVALIPWVTETYTFIPSGPITTLTFTGNQPVAGFYGAAIDNVSLLNIGEIPVPEPASGLLVTLGGCLILARRKARRREVQVA